MTGHLPECERARDGHDGHEAGRYRLVLRGELGEPFGFLFEGMQMDRVAGTTVRNGRVVDQAHLHGIIQRTQELGLELISVGLADEGTDEDPADST